MATTVYDSGYITLIDGTEIYLTPLKIKYLRDFMATFEKVKFAKDDEEATSGLVECARLAMRQYYPSIKTTEDLEDNLDLPSVYKVLDIAAGIKVGKSDQENAEKAQVSQSGSSWETLDLAKIESEVFLLGIWKDYEDLEASLSMPELIATLESKRELSYQERKFMAGLQGVDLEENNDKSNAWEEMKARVFSGGKTENPNDIVALQGVNAQKAGFGIGLGLEYERID